MTSAATAVVDEGIARSSSSEGYTAFITYSTKRDYRTAQRLEALIEGLHRLRLPPDGAPIPRVRVFVDSSDLRGKKSLKDEIARVLAASKNLVVLCSPEAAKAPWVEREHRYRMRRVVRVPHSRGPSGCHQRDRRGAGDRVISIAVDGSARAWGTDGALLWDRSWPHETPLALDAARGNVVVLHDSGRIHVLRASDGRVLSELERGTHEIVTDIRFDPSGRWLSVAEGNAFAASISRCASIGRPGGSSRSAWARAVGHGRRGMRGARAARTTLIAARVPREPVASIERVS